MTDITNIYIQTLIDFSTIRANSATTIYCPQHSESHRHIGHQLRMDHGRNLLSRMGGTYSMPLGNISMFRNRPQANNGKLVRTSLV
jgi:hypothetical protein